MVAVQEPGGIYTANLLATVTLGNLSQTYNASPRSVTATTLPAGLTVNLTYNGSTSAPTDAGSYTVIGTVNDPYYQGSATNTLIITKAAATVTLGSLNQTYNGSPRSVTATTLPAGLTVNFTYNGSTSAPTDAGNYTVIGTISNANYQGSATDTLVINPVAPSIVQQPLNQPAVVGANVSLDVAATGSPLYYQWFKNGVIIPSATQSTVAFNPVALSNAAIYSVLVSNIAGSVTSSNAVLAVRPFGAPVIWVDGQLAVGSVTKVFPATASVTMVSGFANGIIYYTTNGNAPSFGSTVYNAPIIVSNTVVVRALGLDVDTFATAEAPAVTVIILPTYGLTLTTSGSGTVAALPSPGPYASNTVVSVTATTNSGWMFDHWSGDASGSANPLSVTMDRPKLVQAVFVQLFPATATALGGGSVDVIPAQASYSSNSVVTLTATASNGWTFLRWSGDASGTNNPRDLTVNAPKNVVAVFGTTVGTSVIGSGVIELNATNPIPYGTMVRATAIPNDGSYFTQWGSALAGTNSPAEFAVVSTNLVRAVFATLQAGQAALSLRIIGGGSVDVMPRQQVYTVGDSATLTATPLGTTNQFNGWSGDVVSTANPLVITLNTNKVVTANFSPILLALGITQQSGNVLLSWPVIYSNHTLLGSATLTGSAWLTNTSPRLISGANVVVTVPLTNSRMFYRLKSGQ